MSRLAEDIALLDRAARIAGKAIWPDGDSVVVPITTLDALVDEVRASWQRGAEYRLIRREAVWLVEAAREIAIERLDDSRPLVERWTRIAELLRAGVELDLVNARKSLGAL